MPPTRLTLSRVQKDMQSLRAAVLGSNELLTYLKAHREAWGAPKSMSIPALVSRMVEIGAIREVVLKSEGYTDVRRYVTADSEATPYDYALSLRGGAYLCHASAVAIHNLTEQLSRTIYVNKEQSPKPEPNGELSQGSIARAFASQQRKSAYSWKYDGYRIVLLSGKNSRAAGVVDVDGRRVTGLERTLLDITVRPRYAGGPYQVMEAYRSAQNRIDVQEILSLLKRMNYKYPYHQSIRFYLSRTGWSIQDLQPFLSLGISLDFYLDYAMASPAYDSTWRVYFPKGI